VPLLPLALPPPPPAVAAAADPRATRAQSSNGTPSTSALWSAAWLVWLLATLATSSASLGHPVMLLVPPVT
jgi:hypothetical protein